MPDSPPPSPDPIAYTLEPCQAEGPLSWTAVFGNDRPVELEVGTGKGLFLVNAGGANPAHNFVGVELSRKYAAKAAGRLAKSGLTNVKVVRDDARHFLAHCVPTASLRVVHVYFPDPWWKARHKKRRVFGEPFVADVGRVLEPAGELRIATDVEEYYGVIRGLVAAHPRFEELPWARPSSPEQDQDTLTNFERKYRIEGRPIYRARYRLK